MAREFGRSQRVADFLKRELASLIQREMRDPRLGMVGVNEVEISRDLAHAKIFVTILGKESHEAAQEPIEVLNKAAGFLRSQLAKTLEMRTVPRLHFVFDDSVYRGASLSSLIDEARAGDADQMGEQSSKAED